MKLSLILELIDKASRPMDRSVQSVTGMGRAAKTSAAGVGALDRQMDRASRSAGRLGTSASRIGGGIATGARRGAMALMALDRRMQISQKNMEKLAYRGGSMVGGALRGGAMTLGAAGVAAGTAALWKTVTAGVQFERYQTQLSGLEGGAAAGQRAMNWVTDFARKTPYEIGDVMEAFIALKAYGINPTDGSLRTLGDTAASMNKGLMDAVEMMADAQTGEFERLKAFGITVSQAGDKVTLKFRKDGKDMTQTVKKNGSDIQRALMGIFDSRFAGGMDRLSRITDGKWSGIMDRMTINANRVWKGGFGGAINEQLDRIDEAFSRAEKDGSLDRWAKNAGKGIGDFIRTMADADWERIGGDLKGIAGAIRDVAGALSWLDKQRKAIADFQTTAENVSGWAGRLEYTQSGGLKYHAPNWAKPAAPRPSAPARKSPGNNVPFIDASRPQSAPSGKVKVDIELKGAAAQGARTRVSSSSPQVPVTVNAAKRGQAMAAPA